MYTNFVVTVYQGAGGGQYSWSYRLTKVGFEQNFSNCKTTQKQVSGTKWGSVRTGFPLSGTVQVERLPARDGLSVECPLSTYNWC